MSSSKIIIGAVVLLAIAAGLTFSVQSGAVSSNTVVVYKSPTCGCCKGWVEHMRASGFEVEVRDMNDVTPVKNEQGVRPEHRSCHTALVGGYVVEGHVPAAQITRMLAEQPAIRGLAVPGMPAGSPGMEQGSPANYKDYDVVAFTSDGTSSVYARIQAGS
jgi:hypothetical protein